MYNHKELTDRQVQVLEIIGTGKKRLVEIARAGGWKDTEDQNMREARRVLRRLLELSLVSQEGRGVYKGGLWDGRRARSFSG